MKKKEVSKKVYNILDFAILFCLFFLMTKVKKSYNLSLWIYALGIGILTLISTKILGIFIKIDNQNNKK